jgi:hypothetical protein
MELSHVLRVFYFHVVKMFQAHCLARVHSRAVSRDAGTGGITFPDLTGLADGSAPLPQARELAPDNSNWRPATGGVSCLAAVA